MVLLCPILKLVSRFLTIFREAWCFCVQSSTLRADSLYFLGKCSAYACNQLDIAVTPRPDHAKYLKSWMRAIKDNKQSLMKASGLANKSLTFMNDKQPQDIKAVA